MGDGVIAVPEGEIGNSDSTFGGHACTCALFSASATAAQVMMSRLPA
jgi:hypothetical protein